MTNAEIVNFLNTINVYKTKLMVFLKNHYIDVYKAILNNTNFLDSSASFAERLYCVKNNIMQKPVCPVCGKKYLKFKTDTGMYRGHCSVSCASSDKTVVEKKRRTKNERYGDSTYVNIEKSKRTRIEKYGSYHSADFNDKRRTTLIERYGDASYVNHEKFKRTCIEKYGADHFMKNNEFKNKFINQFKAAHDGATCSFSMPENVEKTKRGIRARAWRYMSMCTDVKFQGTFEDFEKISDISEDGSVEFKCLKCGNIFKGKWDNGMHSQCPACSVNYGTSNMEKEIFQFLEKFVPAGYTIHSGDNKIIAPKQLDIVVLKNGKPFLAVEFDGIYWHSDLAGKPHSYHLDKTAACHEKGIKLIHVFENEWLNHREIVESRLLSNLGVFKIREYARNCEVRTVDAKTSSWFNENNHLQGDASASVRLGLFKNDELISLMTFAKPRFSKKYQWELVRFCNRIGYCVCGGASKLLKYFEKNYNPSSIISYADARWSDGCLYNKLGFEYDHMSAPNYWYFKPNSPSILYHRVNFQKAKLAEKLKKYDSNLTEYENMNVNGYGRIYDCGNYVFIKRF